MLRKKDEVKMPWYQWVLFIPMVVIGQLLNMLPIHNHKESKNHEV